MFRVALLIVPLVVCCSPAVLLAPPREGPSRMSYLDNGTVRIGVDLELGGAITWLSKSGEGQANLVNNWDWGRQIQMSFYSGPTPFTPGGKQPAPEWKHIGWNPVQAGDHFGNRSKVIEHRNDGRTIALKCVPMQWPLDGAVSECTFASEIRLEGSTVRVSNRLLNARSDKTQYHAHDQELPALYTVGTLYKLMTYTGDKPFTGDELSRMVKTKDDGSGHPWVGWEATENWAALVNDDGWGVGVWTPGIYAYAGGFAGQPGKGGTKDGPTGYIAPRHVEILDHNITYDYSFVLILGTLEQIRKHVYDHAERPTPPAWRFANDRQHWHMNNAADAGWPIREEWSVILEKDDPQLISPKSFWLAKDAPKLYIEAAFHTRQTQAEVFWTRHDAPRFGGERRIAFPVVGDGAYRHYEVDLTASPEYRGAITGLRIDPVGSGGPDQRVRVRAISLQPAR